MTDANRSAAIPQLTVQEAFNLAAQHHQGGRLREAEQHYRQILAREPNHAESLHLLGVIAGQAGKDDAAIELIGRAVSIKPNVAEAHCDLGSVLRHKGQLDEAIAAYRRAIAVSPNLAEAHSYLGIALADKGMFDDALAATRRAIALDPKLHEAHHNLGNVLVNSGRLDEAIAAYGQAIALRPDQADAYYNLGVALGYKGQADGALAAYRQAVALRPNHVGAQINLALVLRFQGHLDEAIAALRHAIAIRPDRADAHSKLGGALEHKGLLDDATAAFRQAIALNPNLPNVHSKLGNVLKNSGRLDGAIAAYRQGLALNHSDVIAHSNLAYTMHFHADFDAEAIAREHRDWNRRHGEPLLSCIKPHGNERDPDRRLRIGYVSPDLRQHPVGLFLLPLLENHDRREFEVFAYSNSPDRAPVADAMTARLRSHTDCWRGIAGLSDVKLADLIREDRIDILVDLTLHMAHNRLLVFARKPAPVQVTYLAYAGSSGLSTMDYRLSDPYLDPFHSDPDQGPPGGDDSLYSEQTVRLPETYWCYAPIPDVPNAQPPALASGFITFGCLNNFCKVNDPLLNLWARLLRSIPKSRLILHAHEGSHRQRVLDYLQHREVDPSRVSFVGKLPREAYVELHNSIDIVLDTAPYGGGTTTCDALWMGVPVVSLVGKTAVGRGGMSILSNAGLPELAAHTPEEYVRIAADLANDLPRLIDLRSTLRQRMKASPLMDAPKFARDVESAFRRMWRAWCEGP